MSRTFPSKWKKAETNSKPRLEVMCEGTPCLEKTWRTNNLANIGDVMVLIVGININCLVRQLTMTNIVLEPSDMGNFSIILSSMAFQESGVVLEVGKDGVSETLSAYKWYMI